MELREKTILITGAARRIGREMAHAFADKGAHVLIHYNKSEKEALELVTELQGKGVKSEAFQADLRRHDEIQAMARQIIRDYEMVDVLINNASSFYPTPYKTTNDEHWDDFFAVHVKAPFFLAQQFSPAMKRKSRGCIINMVDWTGLRPMKNYVAYCTSKAALLALTKSLAKELAPEILVNAVCPGPILAPLGMEAEEQETVAEKTLLKRWGSTADIVKQVLYLAEQNYATGSYFVVDGGQSLI